MRISKAQEKGNGNGIFRDTPKIDKGESPSKSQQFQYFDEKQVTNMANGLFKSLDIKKKYVEGNSVWNLQVFQILKKSRNRIFKVNAVLLHHQLIEEALYHVILLLEFFQQIFLVFYPVIYRNTLLQTITT